MPTRSECRTVVLTKYPNAEVRTRDHPGKNRFRVWSGDRPSGKPPKWLNAGWCKSECWAWYCAFKYTLPRIAQDLNEGTA